MSQYVLNRNYVVRSLTGHSVSFVKGVPTFVPAAIEREVRAIGAERVDGANPDVLEPETGVSPPLSADERAGQIHTAFSLLIERNDSKDFTGAGVPTVRAVEKLVDFDVDRNEVVTLWQAYKAGE
jgi:hypothetical protein